MAVVVASLFSLGFDEFHLNFVKYIKYKWKIQLVF
jgi:hypothetical protein